MIQLFVPTFRVEECLSGIRECLEKGWTGLGFKTAEFEEKWKEYTGFAFAHFLNSATAGLHLALHVLRQRYEWSDGDDVISTPLTFVSTNHAILYENLRVVFADIDGQLCLDPEDVEKKITDRTKAVLFVGIGGNIGKYYDVVDICRRKNLRLILDASHMAGTRYRGAIPGKEADAVVYSFQAVKNLPTADSGMVCFRDRDDDQVCRKMTWLGINKDTYARSSDKGAYKWKYDVEHVGYKYHGNSIMAAIGLVQLKYLDVDNAYRRQIASWYRMLLGGNDRIRIVPVADGCECANHLFIIEVNNRDELLLALNECEIYPGVHYRDNTDYRMYSESHGTCPNASRLSERILSLPLHLRLTRRDVELVCEKVTQYAK